MADFVELVESTSNEPQARCERCKLSYGKPQKHNESLLRCETCDFPFGETVDGIRALAFALQDPKQEDFVDVHSQAVCYIWFRLVRDSIDLTIETYGYTGFGNIPDWLDNELSNMGWDDIIAPAWQGRSESDFAGKWNNWGLENGICPNQPFLIEMLPPRYYRCSWEYEEWDVEYDWEIVMRAPRSPKAAARSWDLWKTACAKNREAVRKGLEREKYKREHDVEAMFLRHDVWGGHDRDIGYIVSLCSKHGGGWLLQGRSPSDKEERQKERPLASHDRALLDLLANVKERLPHLDPEVIRKLPWRGVGW